MSKNKKGYKHQDCSFWFDLISAQGRSGQSVKRYCQSQGVSLSSFYRWQKLLQRQVEPGSGFRPIHLQNQALESGLGGHALLEVALPGGLMLRFQALPAVEYLHRLSERFQNVDPC